MIATPAELRIFQSVATLVPLVPSGSGDALENIQPELVPPGAIVLVQDQHQLYEWRASSTAAPSSPTVVASAKGTSVPGRWHLLTTSTFLDSVATVAALAAVPSSGTSDLVWVETLQCFWHRNSASTLTPDGITVVAALGGGNWERVVATSSPSWLKQANWRIDSVTGDDENTGGALAPLATFDELNRRLSVGMLMQDVEVTVAAGSVLETCALQLNVGDYTFRIRGEPTEVASDSIATYSNRDHAVPVATQITATGIPDWSPYAGVRIRVTSGVASGALSWIARANPGGVGVATARVTQFAVLDEGTGTLTAVSPSPGDTFSLETLPTISDITIFVTGNGATGSSRVQIYSIDSVNIGLYGYGKFRLRYDGGATTATVYGDTVFVFRSKISGQLMPSVLLAAYYTLSLQTVRTTNGLSAIFFHVLFDNGSLLLTGNATGTASVLLDDFQAFDAATAINLEGTQYVTVQNGCSGSGNTRGLRVGATTNSNAKPCLFGWVNASSKPNLLGTTQIVIEGLVDQVLTWAGIGEGFSGDEQKGIGTLVNGTATVLARNASLRGVVVSHATLAGTAVGVLTVPVPSRTASQFVVNAVNSAGALVDDDSTFDWHIPAMARGVRICQLDSSLAPV